MEREAGLTSESATPAEVLREVLGYINFSNGTEDPRFLRNLNALSANGTERSVAGLRQSVSAGLESLKTGEEAFSDTTQARAVIRLTLDEVLPAYRQHHVDLLQHLPDEDFERVFLVGRLFEAVLAAGGPWDQTDRIIRTSLEQVNDFLGYRPLAVLDNGQHSEPYAHERFRPTPLYVRGAGVADGPYRELLERTIEFFRTIPDALLQDTFFDLERMDELALDVRAHDHTHPVNKRTNYMFGEWDPHLIDNRGYYRRFVLRKIILDSLLDWINTSDELDRDEVLYDASAVLCGTMLMASSISGSGPNTYDSTVSLTQLLPRVARHRDAFYSTLMERADGARAKRLTARLQQSHQPFGHVRQELNRYLARYGARQVIQRQIAYLYARMGYEDAARAEASKLPTVSLRFECEIHCRISIAHRITAKGELAGAAELIGEIEDLLQRGIECGALADPWNILAFQGQFQLFSAREDVVPDNRIEALLEIMERVFGLYSRTVGEAAARGSDEVRRMLTVRFEQLADRWDRYATGTVEELPNVNGRESFESARNVAHALSEWYRAGEAAGDISFWRKHVANFRSAKAYALVVQALLQKKDHVAAMGLLMQWLSDADQAGLESGPYAIHPLLHEWLYQVTSRSDTDEDAVDPWSEIRRLFDYIEANSGEYWNVPQLSEYTALIGREEEDLPPRPADDEYSPEFTIDAWDGDDDAVELFDAAWDGVVFKDSAEDGHAGEVIDDGYNPGNTEFEILNRLLDPRLRFLGSLADLWQHAALALATADTSRTERGADHDRNDVIRAWSRRLRSIQQDLSRFLEDVWDYEISTVGGDLDSNIEFDIQLQSKFFLLHTAVGACVSCRESERFLNSCLPKNDEESGSTEYLIVDLHRAIFRRDAAAVRRLLPGLRSEIVHRFLLYTPLEHGGHPGRVLRARSLQSLLRFLLIETARMGMLQETLLLLQTAYRMERAARPGGMAVTEFDRLFRDALENSLECVTRSSRSWRSGRFSDEELVEILREVVDHYHQLWTMHSRTMRLSSVEELNDEQFAQGVREFIEKYGADLFNARMLTLGNVRAILHNGVEEFLEFLEEQVGPGKSIRLIEDLNAGVVDAQEVADLLELIYESVVDKFDRFLEYNTTTTQSDYGELFYCLMDFLRVEAGYERDSWNLAPLRIAHETLTRLGRTNAARIWETELKLQTVDIADRHIRMMEQLEQKYGVQLPSIRDRINERLVKPLAVNRMVSLVPAAVDDARSGRDQPVSFELLRSEIQDYLSGIFGSGIDVPGWLRSLEDEVNRVDSLPLDAILDEGGESLPPTTLDLRQMRRQLKKLGERSADSGGAMTDVDF